MTRCYLLDGAYHELPPMEALPAGAVEVPRLPAEGEAWSADDDAFAFDGAAAAGRFHALIDAEAEATRTRFITAGAGQAMTYLKKEAEAAAWLADDTVATPFLSAEAAATGTTLATLAATVAARAAAWAVIGPKIEAARLAAKAAVSACGDADAMRAAAQVDWAAVVEGN
jgi:hypothetical protein